MAKPKTKAVQKPTEVMRAVKIYYSDQEITNMGRQMSYAIKEKEALKADAKATADSFKNQIAAKDTMVTTLSNSVNLGYQMIQKTCSRVRNFDRGMAEFWFDGKIVEEEALTSADYQSELDFTENENKKESDRVDALDKTKDSNTDEGGKLIPLKEEANGEKPVILTEELQEQFDAFMKMGDDVYKLKKYDEAFKYYQAAAKVNPTDLKAADKVLKTQNWLDKIKEADSK